MKKPRTSADLKREAEEMVAKGEMPSREDFLRAVAEVRREYQAKLGFEDHPRGVDQLMKKPEKISLPKKARLDALTELTLQRLVSLVEQAAGKEAN